MRKINFLLPFMAFVILYGCKPEGSAELPVVRPEDPKGVSAAIKVWHGVRTQGNPPAPSTSGGAPQLDNFSNNQQIPAISGRYAIIQPQVISGAVKGYYVRVNGATDFFRVDYNKPRELNRTAGSYLHSRYNKALARGLGIDSTGNSTSDSSLVIVIPPTIQPGQFCVTYWAYDSTGNVSNPIVACITISSFGGDASTSYLHGTWHVTAIADDDTTTWEPVYYSDTTFFSGYCVNNHVVVDSNGFGNINYPYAIEAPTKDDLVFGSNGGLRYEFAILKKSFDYSASTCNSWIFQDDSYEEDLQGAWSFNATTNKLLLVFDFDDQLAPDPEFYQYQLIKQSNTRIVFHDAENEEWLRLEK
jgi:hypothetical protein